MPLANDFHAAHVGSQHLWYNHRAIGLLIIFQNGNDNARQRQARSIERMDKFRAFAFSRAIADIGAPRLEVTEPRTRADL